MEKAIRLDLIKLINADAFVAFDDNVRDMMTRANKLNRIVPYIEVNGEYTPYQCFLHAYRLGKYSAADVVCLGYDTDTCYGFDTNDEQPVALAAVEYEAPVYTGATGNKRAKDTVDELASCLRSFLFGESSPLGNVETKCDRLRECWGALKRADVAPKDRVATMEKIATLLSEIHASAQSALIAANYWAARAQATIKALEDESTL